MNKVDELCIEGKVVGLSLKGGGCAGFSYSWDLIAEDDINEQDEIINTERGKLVVESNSIMFLIGTTIDYKTEVFGSHFDIINPNAVSSCGCGESVNIDLDKVMEA